jgi:hypothetical protein
VSSEYRRRPSKEREIKEELRAYRLRASRYPRRNKDYVRQGLWNRRLNGQVGGVAKRTIGLDRLAIRVRVYDLYDPAEGNECTAEEGEHYPQQMTCF